MFRLASFNLVSIVLIFAMAFVSGGRWNSLHYLGFFCL